MLTKMATMLGLGVLLTAPAWAGSTNIRRASTAEVKSAANFDSYETGTAAWIWSDKYVYQPGEQLTLKWSVRTYGEYFPFTLVVYRQNNQTGEKVYYPKGTTTPTDLLGHTVEQGFQPFLFADTDKGVLLGDGGLVGGAVTIPDEPGMHTMVVELRDSAGLRILKSIYMKIGVVSGYVDVSGNIEQDTTWVNTKAYRLSGVVFVRSGATLTIEPGTFVIGQPGSQPPSILIVTRNGKINAAGTRSRPIVMTSSVDFGSRARGDWGGLILLGKAPINVGANAGSKGNSAGEFYIEGLTASEDTLYGGSDSTHNCGTLSYVRVEYAGSIFAANNESNSFTFGGCGTGTTADHLQAIYGLDDSFEWFGGTMNAKYLIGGLGADDYVDYQLGYTGKIQHGIFYYDADNKGNRGIEGDNSEYDQAATPLSKPTMYNLTFIGGGEPGYDEANAPGIFLRRGTGGSFNNILVTNFYSTGFYVDGTSTVAQLSAGNLTANGIVLWGNSIGDGTPETLEGQVGSAALTFAQGTVGSGKNFVVADPQLRRASELSDPDFRPLLSSPLLRATWVQPPDDGFFDQSARYAGGAGDRVWWEEWTNFLQDDKIKP